MVAVGVEMCVEICAKLDQIWTSLSRVESRMDDFVERVVKIDVVKPRYKLNDHFLFN